MPESWLKCEECGEEGEIIARSPMGDKVVCKCPNGHIWKL